MHVYYTPKARQKLDAKLAYVSGPGSRKLAYDLAAAVELGNEHDRLAGLSRYGQPQAPVRVRRGKYKGATGPPTAPFGAASRVIARFKAVVKGSRPPYRILAGWDNVVSKSGYPFLVALDQGVRGGGGKSKSGGSVLGRLFHRVKAKLTGSWMIPPRPIFGISPNTWKLIRSEIDAWKANFKRIR